MRLHGTLLVRDPSLDDVFLALTGRPDPDTQSAVGAVAGLGRERE